MALLLAPLVLVGLAMISPAQTTQAQCDADSSSYLQKGRQGQANVLGFMTNSGDPLPPPQQCDAANLSDVVFPFLNSQCATGEICTIDELSDRGEDATCWFAEVGGNVNYCDNPDQPVPNQVSAQVEGIPDGTYTICVNPPPGICPTYVCISGGVAGRVCLDLSTHVTCMASFAASSRRQHPVSKACNGAFHLLGKVGSFETGTVVKGALGTQ